MKNKILGLKRYAWTVGGLAVFPLVAAAAQGSASSIAAFLANLTVVFNVLIPVLLIIATVIFIFAILRYLFSAGEKQAEMRSLILWSVIGLAAILSLWALVNILSGFFGTDVIPKTPYS